MKEKGLFLCTVLRMSICILAVASFVILAVGGESVGKWIPALLISLSLIGIDVWQLCELRKEK